MSAAKFSLAGKCAVVTGAGRGIGKAIARSFAASGARVALLARTLGDLERCSDEIAAEGGSALPLQCDVTAADQVTSAIMRVRDAFGRIDVLVNNAGGGGAPVPFVRMDEARWDEQITKNLKSAYLCSQAAAVVMMAQKSGAIINMSSVMGLGPHPGRAAYAAAKSGLLGLGATLAVELGPHGIRVNTIAPGFAETERMWKQFPDYEHTIRKRRLAEIPLGRMGTPEDVALAAVFLASDASAYITGQVLRVDGGLVTTVFSGSDETQKDWL